ncbi:MAG: hypothetical protein R3325_00025 [Thermoanaerobaculia bacterium]|nr:hypothetical protein [Thermoanaerobaculia bacterium]
MRSRDDIRLTGLADDLETTPEDVRALRRAAALRPADPFAAVQRLIDALPPASRPVRRRTAAGRPEFVLR